MLLYFPSVPQTGLGTWFGPKYLLNKFADNLDVQEGEQVIEEWKLMGLGWREGEVEEGVDSGKGAPTCSCSLQPSVSRAL